MTGLRPAGEVAFDDRGGDRVLIFDLDGTITDPAIGVGRSLNYALSAFGHPSVNETDVPNYIGPPLDIAFRKIAGPVAPETILGMVGKYRERYDDVGYSENVLYPGIAQALRRLAFEGISMGVCTSKRTAVAERILDMFHLRSHFAFVSGGNVGLSKSEQLRSLVERGEASRQAIMIGDRSVDVMAARENQMRSVGVLWGHGTKKELLEASPDILLQSPSQLLSLPPTPVEPLEWTGIGRK